MVAAPAGAGLLPFVLPMAGIVRGVKGAGKMSDALTDLPMDEASKMARARDTGFDTDVYHGSISYDNKAYDEILPASKVNDVLSDQDFVSVSEHPAKAGDYASGDGGVVYPLRARISNKFDFDNREHISQLSNVLPDVLVSTDPAFKPLTKSRAIELAKTGDWRLAHYYKDYTDAIKDMGFDSFSELSEIGRPSSRAIGIFDPANIRSRFDKMSDALRPADEASRMARAREMGVDDMASALGGGKSLLSAEERAAKTAALRAEANAQRFGYDVNELAPSTDYRGNHTAPTREGANSLDDMSDIYPDDIYNPSTAGQFYGHGGDSSSIDSQSARIIANFKGKPNAEIEVFRAVPKGVTSINDGDWITINKNYAKSHGESWVDDGKYDVISKKIKASELTTDGNSIHEFGYSSNKAVQDALKGKK